MCTKQEKCVPKNFYNQAKKKKSTKQEIQYAITKSFYNDWKYCYKNIIFLGCNHATSENT